MLPLALAIAGALAAIIWLIGMPHLRRRRRLAIARQALPPEWRTWLEHRVGIYARLPHDLQERLHGLIRVFATEKEFVGCNGLDVTEEMRVVIAAYASLLVVARPEVPGANFYDDLYAILVYPTPFRVSESHHDEHGLVTEHDSVLSGQAWDARRILLSWEDLELADEPGYNVALHEFAHYLDMEDETMDGAPGLGSAAAYEAWSDVFWKEFDALRVAIDSGRPTFLDPYAATEPAEFFAVVTEAFFLQPEELKGHHRELYDQLQRYYLVDPASWLSRQ
jgi:Mlc titration factor MtfA (ptsG expression regulator)